MAKIQSAKKAHRGSEKKKQHNLFWKKRIKIARKSLISIPQEDKNDIAASQDALKNLQSVLDKAANNKVIHKNKAARLKSRHAKKLSQKA